MRTYTCSACKKKVSRSELVGHRKTCSGDLREQKGVTGFLGKGIKLLLLSALGLGLAALSLFLGRSSFESLANMRQLERVPATTIRAALPGEINLNGKAKLLSQGLTSPNTNSSCVYYRYVVERKERDSDGDTRWVTVSDVEKHTPFLLEDSTGSITISPSNRVDFSVPESWSTTRGDMRYTEYRIDPGDGLFIFGFALRNGDSFEVSFTRDGHYQPIISELGETRERVGMAGGSIAMTWLGLVCLAMALSVFITIFRQHRLLLYFSILNTAVVIYLVALGLNMMKLDLQAATERLTGYRTTVQQEIQTTLQSYAISWQGDWTTLPDFEAFRTRGLPQEAAFRLDEIRLNLARAVDRVRHQRSAFPERFLAPLWGIQIQDPLPLPESQQQKLRTGMGELETARVPPLVGWIIIGVSLLTGILAFGFGFRKVKFKRCMENIPTSPTTGAAYGVSELKGVVDVPESADFLSGPLSHQPCVQYHYVVKEKRGSGKKSSWVTLINERRQVPFRCQDGHGSMLIDPAGAEIHTTHTTRKGMGRRRYTETRLEVGDPLYAIGSCTLDPTTGTSLYLQKPEEKDLPFILSNMSETRVMLRIARTGILLLNVSFAGILLMALLFFGLSGSFAATDYLAAALVAPVFMTFVTLALHYNDLIFLRERANRNWSNIDVSLQKRSDVVPQIENITKGLMQHEREVQETVAEMRTLQNKTFDRSPEGLKEHLHSEHASLQKLIMLREANPNLISNPQVSLFMRTLIVLENELSLMRDGYNDAVETYNTRIQSFPDLLFAKLFHFEEKALLFPGTEATRIPPSIQNLWESEQTPAPKTEEEPEHPEKDDESTSAAALLAAGSPAPDPEPAASDPSDERSAADEFMARLSSPSENDLETFRNLESAYPQLRSMSPSAYRQFKAKVVKAMEEDEVITPMEFALQKSMSRTLDTAFGYQPERPIRHRNFETMIESVSDLLSMLAMMEETPETRQAAFDLGVSNLNHSDKSAFTFREIDSTNLITFDQVLEDIAHAVPMCKANILYACDALIRMNEDATPDQVLLMCAIADTLDRPRPDWTEA